MPRCPGCNSEINNLIFSLPIIEYSNVTLRDNGRQLDYEVNDTDESTDSSKFECPECNRVLFFNEQEVIRFLREDNDTNDEPVSIGMFFCERHQVRFNESCIKCLEDDKLREAVKLPEQGEGKEKGWYV